jgi:CheY-like chemotaxis protein
MSRRYSNATRDRPREQYPSPGERHNVHRLAGELDRDRTHQTGPNRQMLIGEPEWQERANPAGRDRPRAVVADRNALMRTLQRAFLEHRELEVVGEAEDGIGAVTLALGLRADLLLLEVDLPGLDGFAAAELIGWQQPQTRLLLHTENPTAAARGRAAALGMPLIDRLDLPEAIGQIADHPLRPGARRDDHKRALLAALPTGEGAHE